MFRRAAFRRSSCRSSVRSLFLACPIAAPASGQHWAPEFRACCALNPITRGLLSNTVEIPRLYEHAC
eukprot:7899841-Alexandrium_andersonii.AAC.1